MAKKIIYHQHCVSVSEGTGIDADVNMEAPGSARKKVTAVSATVSHSSQAPAVHVLTLQDLLHQIFLFLRESRSVAEAGV